MFRYKLRTLLILLAFFGLVFARIGYLKHMGDSHREKAARLMRTMALTDKGGQPIALSHRFDADGGVSIVLLRDGVEDPTTSLSDIAWGEMPAETWEKVMLHETLANRCDRAMYRPWTLVDEHRAQ
jgi:hypothetical protein